MGFWVFSSLDSDLKKITQSCLACLQMKKKPIKIPLNPWVWPTIPWHRIHADFLGSISNKTVLVIVDSHSKWPEAFAVQNMSEQETVQIFNNLFTQYGYPSHVVTDNFQSFVGEFFTSTMKRLGIRHSTTPPHCPATNGAVENFVDTFKRKQNAYLKMDLI